MPAEPTPLRPFAPAALTPRQPATGRLVVCGWDAATRDLLRALNDGADLRAAAIGDVHAAQLVRARAATGLPSFQHVREMLRTTEYDAVLLQDAAGAADAAAVAGSRGARLLLTGRRMTAAALGDVGIQAVRHGVSLSVLRPALRSAGVEFVTTLSHDDAQWWPSTVHLALEGPAPAVELLRDGLALLLRLFPEAPTHVTGSMAGGPYLEVDAAGALAAHLRFPNGRLATIVAQSSDAGMAAGSGDPGLLRLDLHAPRGRVLCETEQGTSTVTVREEGMEPRRQRLSDGDLALLEGLRIARGPMADATDERLVHLESATLGALESAFETGQTHTIEDPSVRSMLRVLPGGDRHELPDTLPA